MNKMMKRTAALALGMITLLSAGTPLRTWGVERQETEKRAAVQADTKARRIWMGMARMDLASPADAEWKDLATWSNAARRAVSSLGDIWDDWAGKTSFEFLDGDHGDGSEEKPFLIKNREQLMGLSELTAMGMMVQEGEGVDYAGDYRGCSFALAGNIDLQGVNWIPIGFYRDSTEMPGTIVNTFQGRFDGNGHTIRNLKLNRFASYDYVGLFGMVENGEITNVVIEPDGNREIMGHDQVGILAGAVRDSIVRNITIKNGYVRSEGTAGGIVGELQGTVLENADCINVKLLGQQRDGETDVLYVGGIAGTASSSTIVDCQVSTGNNETARIQGTGYVGGITGFQNGSDVYNVRVSGTIGGRGSLSIGGITGIYSSGKMKAALFEGTIANSMMGSKAKEGTFIGTREGASTNFNYIQDVAYLFADSEEKISADVCGSGISDDNDYTYGAHIGYWHSGDNYFTLIQGGNKKTVESRYFYEELEEGIISVMDEQESDTYRIDHYAPNSVGRPVKGYLVMVNQVDTRAGGQDFYDVASLSVIGSSRYSKEITKEQRGAVAAGSTVYINTSPNNTDTEKFQLEKGPYYYTDSGEKKLIPYSETSHCYPFTMPEEDVVVAADYKKVAVSVLVEPEIYHFGVIQTRTGDRKKPSIVTEVKSQEGKLIARYINGALEQGTSVLPVSIRALVDTNNDVEDSRVRWSVDDPELITLLRNEDETPDGYTAYSAGIRLNLDASFFTGIIQAAEQKQADENYQYKIPATIYGAGHQNGGTAVLTAQTRKAASFEGKPCTASSRINVTFQILDHTLIPVDSAVLDQQTLEYTVTRTLTGDRKNPDEVITVTPPQSLSAAFTPDYFSRDQVLWSVSDPAVLAVIQDSTAYREASVSAYKDAKWIRDIMAGDNGIRHNDPYARLSGKGERQAVVTVNGNDQLGNHAQASCPVTVRFVTDDRTRIVPEGIRLNRTALEFRLCHKKNGGIDTATVEKTGFEQQKLTAVILPELEDTMRHKPYDKTVVWTSSDPTAVIVSDLGVVTAMDDAPWIKEALSKAPYYGEKTVTITAETKDGNKSASCEVKLIFQAACIETDRRRERFDIVLTKTGPRTNPILTWTGLEPKSFQAKIYSDNPDIGTVVWNSSDHEILQVSPEGAVTPILFNEKQEITADWIKEALKEYPYRKTTEAVITPSTADKTMENPITVSLTFSLIDKTYSTGGSGAGNSGGGGGGGSTGVTPSGKTQGTAAPAGSITGIWTQAANGKWLFASGRTYAGEWAYINNPYAAVGQPAASWFCFDKEGFMLTGWYVDAENNKYYLNPAGDGTQGQMLTGWQIIDGIWYYFNPESDGSKGKLLVNTVIDGKYRVNEKGQWVENGVIR